MACLRHGLCDPFPLAPLRTPLDSFLVTRLSSNWRTDGPPVVASVLDVVVTVATDNQRFPSSCYHPPHPFRSWRAAFWVQVCKFADMMHFNVLRCSAELTGLCQEALHHLASATPNRACLVVVEPKAASINNVFNT